MREIVNEKDDEVIIDLGKLGRVCLHWWWVIALVTILSAALAFYITTYYITPLYQSTVTVYVNNTKGGGQIDSVSSSNLSTSQQLVNTYMSIIKSESVLNEVIESGNLDLTTDEIRKIMTTSQMDKTELFVIQILYPDPEMAAYIANVIAYVAPAQIESFVEGSSTKIIDFALVADKPYSPNWKKNTALGAVIGFILAVVVIVLRHLLDTRIKDEEELTALSNLPILGRIPSFHQKTNGRAYQGYQ